MQHSHIVREGWASVDLVYASLHATILSGVPGWPSPPPGKIYDGPVDRESDGPGAEKPRTSFVIYSGTGMTAGDATPGHADLEIPCEGVPVGVTMRYTTGLYFNLRAEVDSVAFGVIERPFASITFTFLSGPAVFYLEPKRPF